jgi:hypothetical protein
MLTEPVDVSEASETDSRDEGDEIPSPIRILVVFSETVHSPI